MSREPSQGGRTVATEHRLDERQDAAAGPVGMIEKDAFRFVERDVEPVAAAPKRDAAPVA